MLLNIPNYLTISRIIIAPIIVFIYLYDIKYGNLINTFLFIVAAITDWLDGYLARKWNQSSKLGAFLDPVADKLLVITLLVLIISDVSLRTGLWNELLFLITIMIIISREITISALREWMAEIGKRDQVAVSNIGKYKTTLQMTAIGFILFRVDLLSLPVLKIGEILMYTAGVLTAWSMYVYFKSAWRVLKSK